MLFAYAYWLQKAPPGLLFLLMEPPTLGWTWCEARGLEAAIASFVRPLAAKKPGGAEHIWKRKAEHVICGPARRLVK